MWAQVSLSVGEHRFAAGLWVWKFPRDMTDWVLENLQVNVEFATKSVGAFSSGCVRKYVAFGARKFLVLVKKSRVNPTKCVRDNNWPRRLCDLTPCEFYVWGFIKPEVYRKRMWTIPEFKEEIRRVILTIELEDCGYMIINFLKKLRERHMRRGEHLPDIILHISSNISSCKLSHNITNLCINKGQVCIRYIL